MAFELGGLTPLLQVYDMPAAVRFYRDVLGFEVVSTSPPLGGDDRFHWAMLRSGGAQLMLNTAYEDDDARPTAPDAARVAAHDDTALYIGCPDIDAVYDELRRRNVELRKPIVTGYGMKQLYLKDPDGYTVCFQCPADT